MTNSKTEKRDHPMTDPYTDEEWEIVFDPMHDLLDRWGLDDHPQNMNAAEEFLEESGYYDWHGL